jgi:hypothetical protein
VTHLLLIRLTETFVIELQTNQEVWGLVEDEPTSLGSIALQQVCIGHLFETATLEQWKVVF